MKFTNILFVGAALIEATSAFKLQCSQIDTDAAKSAAHAAATYAKENGKDVKHAVSQANATIKHYDGATAQSHVLPDASHKASKGSMHESDSKHDTVVKAGTPGPKEVVHAAAAKAKKAGGDPVKAAQDAIHKIAVSAKKAGIKPGPKNIVSATAHMAKDTGHNPKTAAVNATKKITEKAKKVSGVPVTTKATTPVKAKASEGLHEPNHKHDTVVKAGTPGPKAVLKKIALKAKNEGKDPVEAAKKYVATITKAGGKAGIKPGPKQVVQHAARLAKEQGHDPKKAAAMATKKITDAAHHMDKTTGKISHTTADTTKPVAHKAAAHKAAASTMHESNSKHDTVVKAGVPGPKAIVKAAAIKAKQEGKDPAEAAKAAISKMAHAAKKAGIKPGPKNIVSATAHMAKDAGHDPKKAAVMATKKITDKAKKVTATPIHTKAPVKAIVASVKPAAHAAIATASTN